MKLYAYIYIYIISISFVFARPVFRYYHLKVFCPAIIWVGKGLKQILQYGLSFFFFNVKIFFLFFFTFAFTYGLRPSVNKRDSHR